MVVLQSRGSVRYAAAAGGPLASMFVARETSPGDPPKPRLLDRVRAAIRTGRQFLTALTVKGKVVASTQNQALSALLFLYREVLEQELSWIDGVSGQGYRYVPNRGSLYFDPALKLLPSARKFLRPRPHALDWGLREPKRHQPVER